MKIETEVEEIVESEELLKEATDILNQRELILFNGPQSMDLVVKALMMICSHTIEQAEQCMLIAHNRGSVCVKVGSFEKLKPLHHQFSMVKLTTEIK